MKNEKKKAKFHYSLATSAMSISCRVCKALIDCPKEEVDAFVKSLGEHVLSNSSAITALDLCHPCMSEARQRAKSPPRVRPTEDYTYINVA
jgi:hypothetical protein